MLNEKLKMKKWDALLFHSAFFILHFSFFISD